MTLTASSVSCGLSHTLKYEDIKYMGLTLAKRGYIEKTLVNVIGKIKSNKTLKIRVTPKSVT